MIDFVKMHGLGNDFMVLDTIRQTVSLDPQYIQALSHRQTGVGFDQLLLIEESQAPNIDFIYRIFNADGHEVGQCGNGARCLARYVLEEGLTDKHVLTVKTQTRLLTLHVDSLDDITVNMGEPKLKAKEIPVISDKIDPPFLFEVNGDVLNAFAVNIGNPHLILTVADCEQAPVEGIGAVLAAHPNLPIGANINFMQVIDTDTIRLRVYERGAGETMACGSGACASVVSGILQNILNDTVTVQLNGGDLTVHWAGKGTQVQMRGPATTVYRGKVIL